MEYLEHPVKVLNFQVWWQLELIADVVASLPRVGDIDGEDKGLVAQRLHAVHNLLRQLAVPVDVELEPAVAVGRGRHDLLHRAGGVGAGDVAGVEGLSGCEERWGKWESYLDIMFVLYFTCNIYFLFYIILFYYMVLVA